jgi:hypothetical protein
VIRILEQLRRDDMDDARALSPSERVERAFRLGEEDLAIFQGARGLGRDEALGELARRRRNGRRASGCYEDAP